MFGVAGVVRLALPDSELLARRLLDGGRGLEFNEGLNAQPLVRPRLRARLLAFAGGNVHRWQPTRDLVRDLLSLLGSQE